MAHELSLHGALQKRHPTIEVIYAVRQERPDGSIYQNVTYRGTRARLSFSRVATERMFAIHPAHWRTFQLTECGCSYSLILFDEDEDTWEINIHSEMVPKDGWGKVFFLSQKGARETAKLLRSISQAA